MLSRGARGGGASRGALPRATHAGAFKFIQDFSPAVFSRDRADASPAAAGYDVQDRPGRAQAGRYVPAPVCLAQVESEPF